MVLAEVASEIAGHGCKVWAHDRPEVWAALRRGGHDSLEPVEPGLSAIAPQDSLVLSLLKGGAGMRASLRALPQVNVPC